MHTKKSYTFRSSVALVLAKHPKWAEAAVEADADKQFESYGGALGERSSRAVDHDCLVKNFYRDFLQVTNLLAVHVDVHEALVDDH